MTSSVEVTWLLDGITMHGTLARPDGAGPFPAVVLVAGSGPTDRDRCSPLLPGTNGSARLFAQAFAEAGIVSLRYDKRASGPHAAANVAQLTGKVSMKSHLDELVAAVDVLAAEDVVDASRIVGLGNSEGTLHVLHYATSRQDVPFAGIVLAAPPGRPVGEVCSRSSRCKRGRYPAARSSWTPRERQSSAARLARPWISTRVCPRA